MTSVQSGMGIGEPASQGHLFPDPPVTLSVPLIPEGAEIALERRRKEIKGGQLDMYICGQCGQATNDAPARTMRHSGTCTCLFCEDCGDVIGDTVETKEWNQHQLWTHDSLAHTERGTVKVLGYKEDS